MIIPIGVDCGIAGFCQTYGLRPCSFPFDWIVSYNGVSKCFKDDFNSFFPNRNTSMNDYDMSFAHHFSNDSYEEDVVKYTRRIERLKTILATENQEVLFIRKGHGVHLHKEHNGRFNTIKSDLVDAEELEQVLHEKYPNLQFKIVVLLSCGQCFNPSELYTSKSSRVFIVNIARLDTQTEMFEVCMKHIFQIS
jgi:hypothetical protein